MGLFNKTRNSTTASTSNHMWNSPPPTEGEWNQTASQWQRIYSTPQIATPHDIEALTNAINALEAKVEELQAKLEGMKECPRCMRFTPHWDDDDHYLCNDCR